MPEKDYYDILGVSSTATADEIKRAYRQQAREHHPDVNGGSSEAEQRFKEINEAYEVLRDPEKREIYDRYGAEALKGPGTGSGPGYGGDFGGFSDLFEAFFGSSGGYQRESGPKRGDDLRYDLTIDLEEAAMGGEKIIRVPHMLACKDCRGSGSEGGGKAEVCPVCRGSGQVQRSQNTILGSFATIVTCAACRGEGHVVRNPCKTCSGDGRVRSSDEITIEIPAGVDTGARMRVSGQGNVGMRGGPAGDLYVVFHVRQHPKFRRHGADLQMEAQIGVAPAALGTTLILDTLWGESELEIPPGTQPGQVFKLKDQGLPVLGHRGNGDLYVLINVIIPTDLSGEEKDLLRKFAEIRGEEHPVEKSFFERVKGFFTN